MEMTFSFGHESSGVVLGYSGFLFFHSFIRMLNLSSSFNILKILNSEPNFLLYF